MNVPVPSNCRGILKIPVEQRRTVSIAEGDRIIWEADTLGEKPVGIESASQNRRLTRKKEQEHAMAEVCEIMQSIA